MFLPHPFFKGAPRGVSHSRPRVVLVVAFFLLAVASSRANAQQPAPTPTPQPPPAQQVQPGEEVLTVESNLVQLNVGVVDRSGRAVMNLSQNEFAVYEDGVRQTIRSFEPTQTPFSVVLLLDLSGSTLAFRTQLKMAALRFVDALAPDDRVAVVAFWEEKRVKEPRTVNRVVTLSGFTTDRSKIGFTLRDAVPNGGGGTNLYEALRSSLSMLAKEGKRRKAVVVLTDGVDTSTSAEDRAATINAKTGDEAVAAIKPEANATLNSVLSEADHTGVAVYPLALPSGDLKQLLAYNRQQRGTSADADPAFDDPTPQQVAVYTAARARLDALANRTGGRLYVINRLEDLARQYAEVAAEMRTIYAISYQSGGAKTHDGRWRAIRVEVSRPELIARTKPGYYAR
ncbi:MAG: VWA domain-containing protein [Pyrinomonadaceae bacterium]